MTNPYRTMTRWALIIMAGLLVVVAAGLGLGGDAGLIVAVIGGSFAFSAALTAVIAFFYARKVDRQFREFRSGEYLAHWTYAAGEWLAFGQEEIERRVRLAKWAPLWGLLAVAVVGFPFVIIFGVGVAAMLVAVGLAGGWGVGQLVVSGTRKRYATPPDHAVEAYIGPECALLDGRYFPWSAFGVWLDKVEWVDGAPPMLQITTGTAKRNAGAKTFRVPIPKGREEEARQVMAALG